MNKVPSMKKKWVMANWKMNGSKEMVDGYISELQQHSWDNQLELVIFPPMIYLQQFMGKNLHVGAQNVSSESSGAFTGEVSARMLKELDCDYVLVGHSERRQNFKEDNAIIAKKFHIVKEHGMMPVICIGETLKEYQLGKTRDVLKLQLECLNKDADFSFKECIIAYEPAWAIGSGLTPTRHEIAQVFEDIQNILYELKSAFLDVPMLYGGSVNEINIQMIDSIENCSGVLIGGASLKVKQLLEILKCITCC